MIVVQPYIGVGGGFNPSLAVWKKEWGDGEGWNFPKTGIFRNFLYKVGFLTFLSNFEKNSEKTGFWL